MAQTPPVNFTPPAADIGAELWYQKSGTNGEPTGTLTQIHGLQSVPSIITSKEDITYKTLESDTEFAVKGRRPFESTEIQCIYYKEQYAALNTISEANEELWYYLKLPNSQKTVLKWRGGVDVSISEVSLDSMLMMMLKIGKSTTPEILDELPTAP